MHSKKLQEKLATKENQNQENQNHENQDVAWYFNRVIQSSCESHDYLDEYQNSIQKEISSNSNLNHTV